MKNKALDSKRKLRHYIVSFFVLLLLILQTYSARAQFGNFSMPIAEIEKIISSEPLNVHKFWDVRFRNDKVKRLLLITSDERTLMVKWKRAPRGGHTVNNAPRFEIASYRLQKMFLDEEEYLVPPTTGRSLPVEGYNQYEIQYEIPFSNTECIFGGIQYWLNDVTDENVYDPKRFKTDQKYARHLANMNIFTYLVMHNDSNVGNFLISTNESDPRIYIPDNGFAFGSRESERGSQWREIRVNKLPAKTVKRLRAITTEALHQELGVVLQVHDVDGLLEPTEISENLDPDKGVRRAGNVIQFGLTTKEINGVADRLGKLLKQIDSGKYELF